MIGVGPPLPGLPSALVSGERVAFLGLGSNVGDRLANLQRAVNGLGAVRGVTVEAVSSIYETDPVGGPAQEAFLNCAVRVRARLGPVGLLRAGLRVESRLGRVREVRWGPRRIDVDVLLYEQRIVRLPRVEIPHPRLAERAFALVPLIEVAPGWTLPDGTPLTQLIPPLAPIDGVTMIGRQVRAPRTA